MIKVIHRFWAGRDMPEAYIHYEQEWARLNPGYSVITWTEDVVSDLIESFPVLDKVIEDLYRRDAGRRGIELYVQLADVIGYALIARYGGAYFNCDMQPVRSLPESPNTAWASFENNEDGRIVNAAIGAPYADDNFWFDLIEGLPDRYFANPTDEMVMTTGPGYLTDFARNRQDLYVYPTDTFNYVHWSSIPQGGDASFALENLPNSVVALHHWGHRKDGRSNHIETATQ